MPYILAALVLFVIFLIYLGFAHARGMTRFHRKPCPVSGPWRNLYTIFCGLYVRRAEITQTPPDLALPYTAHGFRSYDGLHLGAWHIPALDAEAPLVVSFNWFGGCKSALLPHAQEFHRMGLGVFMVDLRGHGDSAGEETTLGWGEALDVAAAVGYCRTHLAPRQLVLHGISLGAVSVLRALEVAQITADSLILEAPYDRLLNTVRNRVRTFKMPGYPFGDLLLMVGGLRQGFNPFRHNPAQYARNVEIPALILHGEIDPFITTAEVTRLATAFKTPTTLKIIPNLAHGTAITEQPEIWRTAVEAHLEQTLAGFQIRT